VRREARSAGPLVTETFKEDLTQIVDVIRVEGLTFPFFKPSSDSLEKRARKLMNKLVRMHPNRRYVLVYRPLSPPVKLGRAFGVVPRWHLGELEVRRTLNDEAASAVHHNIDPTTLGAAATVLSPGNRFALLLALPFPDKLDTLSRLLAREAPSADDKENALLLADAILTDLAEEQAALRRRKGRVDDEVMTQKLANLVRLRRHDFHVAGSARDGAWEPLLRVGAGLHALVLEQRRWWRLAGRQRRITSFVDDALLSFLAETLGAYGTDEHGGVELPDGKLAPELVAERGAAWAEQVKRTSAGLLGRLLYERMPEHRDLVRDVDVWQEPQQRVWSEGQLESARRDEEVRALRQEELRRKNVDERAAMLVLPGDEEPARADETRTDEARVEQTAEASA